MWEILKVIFHRHDYVMVHDDKEERNRIISEMKEGESVCFVRNHVCTKCGNEKMLSSGYYI